MDEAQEYLELKESRLNTVKHQLAVVPERARSIDGISPSEILVIAPDAKLKLYQAILKECKLRGSSELTVSPSHQVSKKRKERSNTGTTLEGIYLFKEVHNW